MEDGLDGLFGPRRDRYLEEEWDEEEERRRTRDERAVGSIGLTFYAWDPGMNRYSSQAVFGGPASPEGGDVFNFELWRRDHERGETPPVVVRPVSEQSPLYDPFKSRGSL